MSNRTSKPPIATFSGLAPTERQLSLARSLGITVDGLSRAEVSEVLEARLEHERNSKLDDPRDYEDDEYFEREYGANPFDEPEDPDWRYDRD